MISPFFLTRCHQESNKLRREFLVKVQQKKSKKFITIQRLRVVPGNFDIHNQQLEMSNAFGVSIAMLSVNGRPTRQQRKDKESRYRLGVSFGFNRSQYNQKIISRFRAFIYICIYNELLRSRLDLIIRLEHRNQVCKTQPISFASMLSRRQTFPRHKRENIIIIIQVITSVTPQLPGILKLFHSR